jgi:hypothetical protein
VLYYCTLFDSNYLARGIALYESLVRHASEVRIFILCLDTATHDALVALALPRAELVSIETLVARDPALRLARSNRTPPEFYLTCKPALMRHVFDSFPEVSRLTYVDADVYFFSDPMPVEREVAASDVALTSHRFPPEAAHLKRAGEFNAGWVNARAGEEGRRFVEWWLARCIENCELAPAKGLFGDQKYLEQVPKIFANVHSVAHPGVNVGPWCIGALRIETSRMPIHVEGQPLVMFHFHGMKRVMYRLYDSGLAPYGARLLTGLRTDVYAPYLRSLGDAESRIARLPSSIRGRFPSGAAHNKGWWYRLRAARYIVAKRTALLGP